MKRSNRSHDQDSGNLPKHPRNRHDEVETHPRFFHGDFPYFRKPVEIGSMSLDSARNFVHNRHQLKHYKLPKNIANVHFDLKIGFDSFKSRDENNPEYIDNILKWILQNKQQFCPQVSHDSEGVDASVKNLMTDFICWRGLLTKLLCTPYENREGWQIAVTLFNKTYYMCEFETEQRKREKANMTQREKEMTYWGYKFEQYVTSANADEEPRTDVPVDCHAEFGSVVRSRLASHSLVFSGEVDCCVTKDDGTPEYVELKTSREMFHPKQEINFKRFKLIKWWAQSFLIGIPVIVCGFRDDDGVVSQLKDFKTLEIPKYCKDIQNCWEASVCFNFLNRFLAFVKEVVTEDNPRCAYLFTREPKSSVTFRKMAADSEYCFLPTWYTDTVFT